MSLLQLALGLAFLLACYQGVWGCNEAVCASLVSKCMLLKSCECNMMDKTNCTCCKDCHKCLAKLYTECCSCVGMCAEKNPKDNQFKTSTVEELEEPIPGLFSVLTEEEDPFLRWTTYTYPAHLDLLYFKPRGHDLAPELDPDDTSNHRIRHGQHHVVVDPNSDVQNCTVAYMSQCMSLNKCRTSCQSMGAARYRWFHEYGCCECIANTCLDFGKGEALCLQCPPQEEEVEEEEDYLEYDDLDLEENEIDEAFSQVEHMEDSEEELETEEIFTEEDDTEVELTGDSIMEHTNDFDEEEEEEETVIENN